MDWLKAYQSSWLSHRKALLDLLETVTDDQLHFKPWADGMPLSQLVMHIVGSTNMFVQIVKDGASESPTKSQPIAAVEDLKSIVRGLTDQTRANLEALTEEQLERTVEFATMSMPGQAMLEMAKEHEIHHKGQLFTYLRVAGVKKLPFFINRS